MWTTANSSAASPPRVRENAVLERAASVEHRRVSDLSERDVLKILDSVGKGAKIKNCILGQGTVVGDGAQMNYVITDKDVTVAPKHVLTSSADYQMYVSKGATV